MEKYYKILEIHTNATEQDVKQAYLSMVKVWHPDRFPNDIKLQKRQTKKLKEINDAYQRIINHLKNSHKQQQSQQYERTEKQEKQASQPPPRQTKPNKLRHFKKYWGWYLVLSFIPLAIILDNIKPIKKGNVIVDPFDIAEERFRKGNIPIKTSKDDLNALWEKAAPVEKGGVLKSAVPKTNRLNLIDDAGIFGDMPKSSPEARQIPPKKKECFRYFA